MPRIYRPRMLLRLTVMLPKGSDFEPYTYDVPVVEAKHVSNDLHHADTLSVQLDWVDTGVDPRFFGNALCAFFQGDADEFGAWSPGPDNVRFVGRMVEPSRHGQGDSLSVRCEFHDYTSFFLATKPIKSAAVPTYADTLEQAWRRLCLNTPGAEPLADRLVLRGVERVPVLGDVVSERFSKLGARVAVNPAADAWAIWKDLVGSAGLLTFFELDECIVSSVSDYYTGDDPPRIVWGKNLLDFSERRNGNFELKGVIVQSVDPLGSRPTLEASFNPLKGVHKKLNARPVSKSTGHGGERGASHGSKAYKPTFDSKEYDVFSYPGIDSQEALDRIARCIYEQRARQQVEGSVTTAEMRVDRASGEEFDLLSLRSGDTIEVRFLDTDDTDFVRGFSGQEERARYLVEKGYRESVARVIAANVELLSEKGNLFYVKSVTTDLSGGSDVGSFRVQIDFCNKIDPREGAVAAS